MISVIIHVSNSEKYLPVCLYSILKQTYQDFEVICVDDGSTDSSAEILDYFSKKDSRIKIFKNESIKGKQYAKNKGLIESQGKYILFIDDDTWCDKNAFETLFNESEKNNLDVLMFKNIDYCQDLQNINVDPDYDMEFLNQFNHQVFNHWDLDKTKIFKFIKGNCNKLYLKSFLNDNHIRFLNKNYDCEEDSFSCEVLLKAKRISFINQYLFNKRRSSNSLMAFNTENILKKCASLIIEKFLENEEIYEFYKKQVLDYIFKVVLYDQYNQIENQNKDEYYTHVQEEYESFIVNYGLREDIKKNVNDEILNFFKFDEIVSKSSNLKPKISIIIPVYNVEKYLERTFNSLLNQTIGFNNLEIIFIDDASTDNSPNIIKEYTNKFKNVKSIFLDENSGSAGKPRNIGMKYTTTNYIMFLDSDDVFMDDACEVLYNEITNDDVDIVSGIHSWDGTNPSPGLWVSVFTNPNDRWQDRINQVNDLLKYDFPFKVDSIDDYESIIGDFAFTPKIYKKSLIEENSIRFAEEITAEDSVFLCNVLLNAKGIKYINKIVYLYYHERTEGNDKSMSYIHSKKVLKGLIDAFFMMYDLCLEKNKQEIFKHYLLFQKLEYFLNSRLLKSDLPMNDVLDLLIYATPLFKLYFEYASYINSNLKDLYRFIANEDYENAIIFIYGDEIINDNNFKSLFNKK